MNTRSSQRSRRLLAAVFSFALVAAACGSDDDGGGDGGDTDTTEAPAEGDAGGEAATTEAPAEERRACRGDGPPRRPPRADDDADAEPAGEATGEPFVIGVQNLEGDPAGSFPEYSLAVQAAADYVNTELGGLQGRPIEIELCKSIVAPDDSQRCANELSAAGVELALSTINFFGNHFSIYQGSDIPVLVGTPITIADFTSEGVYSIGAGGGCLGVHTGLVEFATNQIEDELGIEVEQGRCAVGGHSSRRRLLQRPRGEAARRVERLRAR